MHKTRIIRKNNWRLVKAEIRQVSGYKYLGLDMRGNLSWKDYKKRILSKAKRNMAKAWSMGIRSGYLSVEAAVNVWQTLIRSVLEYGAEIWGNVKWEQAEILQREMGRRILGVKKNTSNAMVYGELGWWSLKERRDMIRLRYWRKIINMITSLYFYL